ncbi:enoyl-CoA hydratase domain-containing protein 2, mitochondrial isoform X9 [Panthera tigris]|uniref:enoyl-CoA hydratase domain-containing protein 2, mitochondrial isoform X9 n=1 Tax=Panthera tigris TaxID=9694 RepID=UPI001C6F8734|nr:enoyl-CoA hydratase domain-containing protein 2, mitochondrial isoform X9 [Panthera tigris]
MLRALTSALRLPRPWRPLQTRSCASDGAAGDPEIQVRALAGPDQGITEILMNRPSARNALGNVLVSELLEALARLREDQQVRVLLFRSGVKGVFCAGADLKEREQMSEAEVGIFVQRLRGLMNEIAAFPAPTIAAMDGFALGGGLELALACDLRVAEPASFTSGMLLPTPQQLARGQSTKTQGGETEEKINCSTFRFYASQICHVLHKEPWGQFVTSPVNHKHAWAETLPSGSLVPGKCCNTCSERLSLKSGGRG